MLKVTVLGLGLLTGSLFAQDLNNPISSSTLNGYSAKVFQNGDIKLYSHGKLLKNENVDLVLYKPNNKEETIKNVEFNDNKYHINSDLSQKGNYNYVIKFSDFTGGVNHYLRGEFKI